MEICTDVSETLSPKNTPDTPLSDSTVQRIGIFKLRKYKMTIYVRSKTSEQQGNLVRADLSPNDEGSILETKIAM